MVSRIPKGDLQHSVKFSSDDPEEIMSNGLQRAYFWKYHIPSSNSFTYYSPPLNAKDFKQQIGDFTVSAFVPGTTQAVTGTVDGDVVIWEEQGLGFDVGTRATDRQAVKVMRLVAWFDDLADGAVTSVSFSGGVPQGYGELDAGDLQGDTCRWVQQYIASGRSLARYALVLP